MTATDDPQSRIHAGLPAERPAVPRRTIVLLALCAIVSHSLARSTYPILLPAIEAELLRNHAQAGSLSTVNFGAYLAGVAVVTALSGRLEPIRVLYGGLALAVAGFAVLSQAGSYLQLAAGLALAGMSSAAIWNSTPVIAASLVGPQRRGLVMGLLSSFMGLGIVAASQGTNLVRSLAGDDQVWRPIWVGAASFAAVLLVLMGLFLRPPRTSRVSGG
ncbi:MAG: MFS transporter, partial [Acidimicrobiia bacterium]|nr:MFS transporter [Acidimicrobiia bacterium]